MSPDVDSDVSPSPQRARRAAPLAAATALVVAAGGIWLLTTDRADDGAGNGGAATPAPTALALRAGAGVPGTGVAGGAAELIPASGAWRLRGTLPDGPDHAPVQRLGADVDHGTVSDLAGSLGLTGAPRRWAHSLVVRRGKSALRVATAPGVPWVYSSGTTPCLAGLDGNQSGGVLDSPVECPAAAPDARLPVGPDDATARAAAEPVLSAVGLVVDDARVQRGPLWTTVTVDPVVDGLATSGWSTSVTVGARGVMAAQGWLGAATAGAVYPLDSARAAFDRLAKLPQPEPLSALRCPAQLVGGRPGCAESGPRVVTGAALGLSLYYDGSGPLLVPAWLFELRGSPEPLPFVAVRPAYLVRMTSPGPVPLGGLAGTGSTGGGSTGAGSATGSP